MLCSVDGPEVFLDPSDTHCHQVNRYLTFYMHMDDLAFLADEHLSIDYGPVFIFIEVILNCSFDF